MNEQIIIEHFQKEMLYEVGILMCFPFVGRTLCESNANQRSHPPPCGDEISFRFMVT
jgi:hypothetical protein